MKEDDVFYGHVGRVKKDGPIIPIKLHHLQLQFERRKGDEFEEEDCSCDSTFMIRHIRLVQ